VAVECYLPLLEVLERLAAEGVGFHLTINISPVLAEQLVTELFKSEVSFFLENRLKACDENRQYFERSGQEEIARLVDFWRAYYQRMGRLLESLDGNILTGFKKLMEEGHLEIITSAATHGYLPLLSRDESINLQIKQAVATHRKHFGGAPRGIWLPECAYRPRYTWTPPAGRKKGEVRYLRKGIEEFLWENGLQFFFTDAHMALGGRALSTYKDFFPALRGLAVHERQYWLPGKGRTPYQLYRAASVGGEGEAIAFVRDPKTTLQVWSREIGYPGDGWYLEFHKKHFPGGIRYWRVTHVKADLKDKAIYAPDMAMERAKEHAKHFAGLVFETLKDHRATMGGKGIVCSPYDAELFGHWWFEGPSWLYEVFKALEEVGVKTATASGCLEAEFPSETISLLEGSWGEGGDHRVWLNRETEWTWDRIYDAEEEMVGWLARIRLEDGTLLTRILQQAARELLLLQASDWQFLITTWSARDYAERRFAEHYANFKELMELAQKTAEGEELTPHEQNHLLALEHVNALFLDLDLGRLKGEETRE